MAIALDLDIRIGRPSADVFAHLTDVERWPEWLIASGIVRVERLDGGPLADGSKLRIQQRVAGRSSTLDARVTAMAATSRFAVSGRDADGIAVEIDASLTADGAGTRLDWRLRIGLPLRYRMLESMATPQVRRAAALDLEAFRQRLESVAEA
jgi:carbon monoxide dehydrogenase subunit G